MARKGNRSPARRKSLPEKASNWAAGEGGASLPRLLVADDNADMRQYLARLLCERYQVQTVPDGQAALDSARERRPDLILSDIIMPRLDGIGLLREIRADAALKTVPVILLSDRAGEESRVEGLQEGAADYLIKPFSARELVARVASHLDMARLRKQSEETIRQSEELLRALTDNSPDAIYVKDRQSRWLMANPAVLHIVRRKPEETLGKTDLELYADPAIGQAILENDRRILETGRPEVFEEVAETPEGRRTFLSVKAPRRDADGNIIGLVGISHDITDQKVAQKAQRESEERFRALVQASSDVVFRMSPDWTEMRHLVGRDFVADMEGPSSTWLRKYIHPDDQSQLTAVINEAIRTKGIFQLEHRVVRADGSVGWTFSRAIPILDAAGQITEWFGMASDITARKRAEEALQQANMELARSNKDLEQFAHVAGHDLQEPLRTIKSFLDLLARRSSARLDDKDKQYMGFVVDGATRMQNLISDLLTYSRSSAKSLKIADVPLRQCVEEALSALGSSIQEAGAAICLGDLPAVKADAMGITQVLQNLIGNAVKFRRKDVRPEVSVEATDRGGEVVICVKDNGIGIPPEQCEHVFEVFRRLHNRQEYPGTGIGLAICRKVIERHGGRVWVESEVGKGSSFFFTLPLSSASLVAADQVFPVSRATAAGRTAADMQLALEEAKEEQRRAAQLYETVAWHLPNAAVHVMDRNFRYIFSGGEVQARLGLSHEALLGRTIYDVLPPETLKIVEPHYRRVLQGQTVSYEAEMGGIVFQITAVPLKGSGSEIERILVLSVNVTDRKRAEDAVRQSQKTFTELIERAPFGIYVVDSQFRIAHMNASSQEGAFRNVRPVIGRAFSEAMRILWPEPVAAEIIGHFRHTLETGEPYYSPRFVNPRHDVAIVESYEWELHRMTLPDGQHGVICYYYDSTKLRQTEERVRQLAQFPEENPDPVLRVARDGTLLYANPPARQWLATFQWEDEARLPGSVASLAARAGEYGGTIEDEIRAPDGRSFWMAAIKPPVEGYVNLYAHDITARKQAEVEREQLLGEVRAERDRLSALVNSITDEIWFADAQSKLTLVNPAVLHEFGPDVAAPGDVEKIAASYDVYRPDGTPRPVEEAPPLRALRGEIVKDQEEIVRKLATGELRQRQVNAAPVRDAGGAIIGSVSVVRDITEHKRTETALRESRAKYQALTETTSDFVWEMDAQGRYTYCSPQMKTLWGLSPSDMIGRTPFDLAPAEHMDRDVAAFMALVMSPQPFSGLETTAYDSQGRLIHIEISGVPFFDDAGTLLGFRGITRDITARKRAEAEVARMSALLAEGQEIAHVGSFEYIAETQTTVWSEEEFRIYGLDPSGPPPAYQEMLAKCYFPEDAALLNETFSKAISEGGVYEFEHRIVRPSGEVRWIYDRAHPHFDASGKLVRYVGATVDVTDRRRAEEALRQSEERFRTLANTIPQLTWWANSDGYITWYNDNWYRYTGTTPQQMEGWGWQSVHDPDELPKVLDRWKASIASGEPFDMVFPLRGADGQFRPFLTRVQPLKDASGRVLQWFGTNTDVGELKRAEDALRSAVQELERSNKELEQFAYISAHDLQEPLRQIRAYADLLHERHADKLDGKARQYLEFVHDGATRMSELVSGLLAYRQVRAPSVNARQVSADAVLDAALVSLRTAIEESQADITRDPLPAVTADHAPLKQLFENLISNAVKFRCCSTKPQVHVGCCRDGPRLVFSVRDNGIGIEPQYYEKVFQIFQRLHTRDKYPGAGIGLAICKKIIEQHGGRIWIEPTPGGGSTFYFTWPRE